MNQNVSAVDHSECAEKAEFDAPSWQIRKLAVEATRDLGVIIQ